MREELADEARIRQLCSEHGLAISGVRAHDEVLLLRPESLGTLPDAEQLSSLADRLTEMGWEHVSLDLNDDSQFQA